VPAPATRILWLDRPAPDSLSRHALDRAFDESSLYDETVRTAAFRAPRHGRAAAQRAAHLAAHRVQPRPAARRPAGRGGRA
jgi:hypothetical protein